MRIETFVVDKKNAEKFYPLMTEEAIEKLKDWDTCLIGAAADRRVAGAALLSIDEEDMSGQLLYIAVTDKLRRKGVGKELLNRCLRVLRQFTVSSFECILFETDNPSNPEAAILDSFITSWGMKPSDDGCKGSFSLGALKDKVSLFSSSKRHETANCIPVSRTDRALLASCDRDRISPFGFEKLDRDISYLYLKDGEIRASFLVEVHNKELYIVWMTSGQDNRIDVLISLMECSLLAALKKYPEETCVYYNAWNETAKKLISQILGDDRREESAKYYSISDSQFRLKEV